MCSQKSQACVCMRSGLEKGLRYIDIKLNGKSFHVMIDVGDIYNYLVSTKVACEGHKLAEELEMCLYQSKAIRKYNLLSRGDI